MMKKTENTKNPKHCVVAFPENRVILEVVEITLFTPVNLYSTFLFVVEIMKTAISI